MFLICVFVPFAGFIAWRFRASNDVQRQITRIRNAGLPVTTDELDEFYRIEAGSDDATPHFMAAHKAFSGQAFETACRDLPIVGVGELEVPAPGETWAEQAAVEKFLADYASGVDSLHAAAAQGGAARYDMDFEDGFSMLLPMVQDMRTCSRVLSLEAHVKAHQGDAEGTTQSLLALAQISKSLQNQPVIVSQLVRMAMQGIAVDVTASLLPHVEFTDEQLVQLQEACRRDDFKAGLADSLIGERVLGSIAFENPSQMVGGRVPTSNRLLAGNKEDLALFLEMQSDMRDATLLEYPAALDAMDAVDVRLMAKLATPLGQVRYVLTGMAMPAIASAGGAAARTDGKIRCLDAALAVQRFRQREGKLPANLDELVPTFLPAVPVDPFDGQPIRYQIHQHGYSVYTCGRNRVDDGGIKDEHETDSVIRIEFSKTLESPE